MNKDITLLDETIHYLVNVCDSLEELRNRTSTASEEFLLGQSNLADAISLFREVRKEFKKVEDKRIQDEFYADEEVV